MACGSPPDWHGSAVDDDLVVSRPHQSCEYSPVRGLLAGFGLKKHHDKKRCTNSNGCGKLSTGDNLVNIYHSCKYRSM